MEYDAFISYSRSSDGEFAPRLRSDVRRTLRRWWGGSRLAIFLDRASLVPGGSLPAALRERIEASRHFVLLASPASASSPYVELEVRHWLELHGAERLLCVLTEGELDWRDGAFSPSSVVPTALREVFREAPLYLDLRAFHTAQGRARDPQVYREALAGLAARLSGRTKEWVLGEDRRRKRIVAGVAAAVLVLLSTLGVVAVRSALGRRVEKRRGHAEFVLKEALDRLATDPESAVRMALEAYALAPSPRARELAAAGLEAWSSERSVEAHLGAVRSIEFSADGAALITAGGEGLAKVWSWPGLEPRGELRGHEQALVRAVLSPSGEHAYTLAFDRSACLWRVRDSKLIQRLPTAFGVAAPLPEFTADALWLPSASGGARGFSLETGLEVSVSERGPQSDSLGAKARTSDARFELRWDVRGEAQLIDLGARGAQTAAFTGVSAAAFRPGGHELALCDRVDRVLLIDAQRAQAGGHEIRIEARAQSLQYSPDGRWLAVAPMSRGSSNAAAQLGAVLYDCQQRSLHWVLRPRLAVLVALEFTPDSKQLVVGCAGGEIVLWPVDPIERAERAQPRALLSNERAELGLASGASQ